PGYGPRSARYPGCVRCPWTGTGCAPGPTTARRRYRSPWPHWTARGYRSRPSPSAARPWTTCTCGTPAAACPLWRYRHERGCADRVDDRAAAGRVRAAAVGTRDDADPAGDLAVPVRQPVPPDRRAARLRRTVLSGLPGTRRHRDERGVGEHVGR